MPDAGIFLDHPALNGQYMCRQMFQNGLQVWFDGPDAITGADAQCLQNNTAAPWRCWFAQYQIAFNQVGLGVRGHSAGEDQILTIAGPHLHGQLSL